MNNPKVNVVVSGHRNEYHSTYKTYILRGGIPFADQVIMPDTKYVIKYDFDLGGGAFDLDFSNADTHTVAEVTYYYIPFIADGSKYTLMDDTLVFIDAEWNGLSAREIKPEKGTLFMIASITGGLHKNGYGINVVTVPENCILEFDGGSLDNGVIVGQDTVFINVGDVDIWGKNLIRRGTWREHSGGSEKDKPYDPETHSGLGRKILQLKPDGSNILTQDDFNQDHTIYVVSYDFDLNGAEIHIPEDCILDFEGGSIRNGRCLGNNTRVINYPNNANVLYGVFYDMKWDMLNYCYKEKNDFCVTECCTFTEETNEFLGVAEYQSIVRYGDYLFLMGQPYEQATAGEELFITVFEINGYNRIGTVYTNIDAHANGSTVVDGSLYVCPGRDGDNFVIVFDCQEIVDACRLEGTVNHRIIDTTYLNQYVGKTISWVVGIDYDKEREEFALDVNNEICILDKNFQYLRKTENYRTAIDEKYNFYIGTQDLSYKNGIIYGTWSRYDSTGMQNSSHPVLVTIDSVSGKVIDVKEIFSSHTFWEPQGAYKDDDNEEHTWSLFVERKKNGVAVSSVIMYTIVKIAPVELTLKDTHNSISTDSYIKPVFNNGRYISVYIDPDTANTIQDGNSSTPFKSLSQAIHTFKHMSDNLAFMCKKGYTYEVQLSDIFNRAIRINSFGSGDNPIISISGCFYNSHVSISNVVLQPIKGQSAYNNAAFFADNSLIMMENVTVRPKNYDPNAADYNVDNWVIADTFLTSMNATVDFHNCTFIGINRMLYSLRLLKGTIRDCVFKQIGTLVGFPSYGVADIEFYEWTRTLYTEINRLYAAASPFQTPRPIIKFGSSGINNFLIALLAARKQGGYGTISYHQFDKTVFTEASCSAGIPELVHDAYYPDGQEETIPIRIEGVLEERTYVYYQNEERFIDAFDGILGCAKRGVSSLRPVVSYPFLPKTGMSYYDYDLSDMLYWSGIKWIGTRNNNLKILSVGDSILRGWRNGDKAFYPYITSNYKQDALSGAMISQRTGYGVKDIPQQLVDENSYNPDVIITGTGVNDWALNAPLGTPPTSVVTNDNEAEALDRTTVYGATQYLFYQMIKKFPHALRFFISNIKFDCNVNASIQGKYTKVNTQGYTYVDMLEGIKKICVRYGVVYVDILNRSFVNSEFDAYKAPTKYDDVPEEDREAWNNTYYVDADGLHPTDLCYRKVFAMVLDKELETKQ